MNSGKTRANSTRDWPRERCRRPDGRLRLNIDGPQPYWTKNLDVEVIRIGVPKASGEIG